MGDREETIYQAKLAEQSERYDEMVSAMRHIAKMGNELGVEERNLLSVAYKNVVGARRVAWRLISSVEQKDEAKNSDRLELTRRFKARIEEELREICGDILSLLDGYLINANSPADSRVFYSKMKGDYYRYLAEFYQKSERDEVSKCSLRAYKEAMTIAEAELPTTHPIRLGLALNYSVLYYEILNSAENACKLTKQAFDKAIADLDSISEENYKDSTFIMQLLRDNLALWTATDQYDNKEGIGATGESSNT